MGELTERLEQTERSLVVADTVQLIDNEVKSKKGLSGMALKGGYKVVKRLKNGRMIEDAADNLLDEFAEALEPMYGEYLQREQYDSFETYLSERRDQAANALLSITDGKAKRADNKVLKKTYSKLRGQAEKHVKDALPGVGQLIDKHAPKN